MNKIGFACMLAMIFSLNSLWGYEGGCCGSGCCLDNYPPMRLYASHVEGDAVAYRGGYTSLGLFAESSGQGGKLKPFLDLRGHVFNNGKIAGNLGGGLRYYSCSLNKIFGINSYYDFRGASNQYYHQVGVGLEILGPCLDLRLNGYFPIGRKDGEADRRKFTFPHGLFAICKQQQEALTGFDAEIGRCFTFCLPCSCRRFGFYMALGPYYYESRSCADDIWGGQVRLVTQCSCLGNCLNFEVGASYDKHYHTSGYARVELSVPFYWPCCGWDCCDRGAIYQPVHRQEMIVLSQKHCSWETNLPTGSDSRQFSK